MGADVVVSWYLRSTSSILWKLLCSWLKHLASLVSRKLASSGVGAYRPLSVYALFMLLVCSHASRQPIKHLLIVFNPPHSYLRPIDLLANLIVISTEAYIHTMVPSIMAITALRVVLLLPYVLSHPAIITMSLMISLNLLLFDVCASFWIVYWFVLCWIINVKLALTLLDFDLALIDLSSIIRILLLLLGIWLELLLQMMRLLVHFRIYHFNRLLFNYLN